MSMLVLAVPRGCLGVREGPDRDSAVRWGAGCLFRQRCSGALSGTLHADEAFQFGLSFLGFPGLIPCPSRPGAVGARPPLPIWRLF